MTSVPPVPAPRRPSGDVSVPGALRPTRAFDTASELVVAYLSDAVPLGMWAVTRIVDGRQIMLTVDAPAYGVDPGAEFPYALSMCRTMVSGESPQIAPDVTAVPAYADAAAQAPITVGTYMGTPIVRPDGSLFGTLCGYDPDRHTDALLAHQPLLDLLSSMLSAVLDADSTVTAVERDLDAARREADRDALTGLLNRRGWDRHVELEERRYRRFGDAACVVVLDLDNLKLVNDTHGHDAGDDYIRRAASVLRASLRPGDVLARLGGDEFAIVAHGAGSDQTERLVRRLEQALESSGVSGSFGHAPYSVVTGFPGAMQAADEAMYEQKRRRTRQRRQRPAVDHAGTGVGFARVVAPEVSGAEGPSGAGSGSLPPWSSRNGG